VPKSIEKKDGYTVRVTSGGEHADSSAFPIKAQIPLMVKLAPIAVALGVLPFVINPDEDPELPLAPDPG
jgi:hypothetical protein